MKLHHFAILGIITTLLWLLTNAAGTRLRDEFAEWPKARSVNIKSTTKAKQASLPLAAYQPIIHRNLFGEGAKKPPEKSLTSHSISHIPLARRELPMVLMGIIASSNDTEDSSPEKQASNNIAVILDKKINREGFYKEGDSLHGYTIKLVLPQAVIITNGDKELRMLTRLSKAYMDIAGVSMGPENIAIAPQEIKQDSKTQATFKQDIPHEKLKKSLANLQDVLNAAAISPYTGPKGNGVRLSKLKPGSIYRQLNLKENDIILSINGAPLHNAGDAVRLYEVLQKGGKVDVVILRNNKTQNTHYVIK
jgi:general secretion pathway protein C